MPGKRPQPSAKEMSNFLTLKDLSLVEFIHRGKRLWSVRAHFWPLNY